MAIKKLSLKNNSFLKKSLGEYFLETKKQLYNKNQTEKYICDLI